jgi:hypothetical protein
VNLNVKVDGFFSQNMAVRAEHESLVCPGGCCDTDCHSCNVQCSLCVVLSEVRDMLRLLLHYPAAAAHGQRFGVLHRSSLCFLRDQKRNE